MFRRCEIRQQLFTELGQYPDPSVVFPIWNSISALQSQSASETKMKSATSRLTHSEFIFQSARYIGSRTGRTSHINGSRILSISTRKIAPELNTIDASLSTIVQIWRIAISQLQ